MYLVFWAYFVDKHGGQTRGQLVSSIHASNFSFVKLLDKL